MGAPFLQPEGFRWPLRRGLGSLVTLLATGGFLTTALVATALVATTLMAAALIALQGKHKQF
jgi:hypothetical protein